MPELAGGRGTWFDEGDPVPLHVKTGGVSQPSRRLGVEVLLAAAAGAALPGTDSPERRQLVAWCQEGPCAVVELSARVRLPLIAAQVLISGLLDEGLLVVVSVVPQQHRPPRELMERVLAGLKRLPT